MSGTVLRQPPTLGMWLQVQPTKREENQRLKQLKSTGVVSLLRVPLFAWAFQGKPPGKLVRHFGVPIP